MRTVSRLRLLCFSFNGDLYTQTLAGASQKLEVNIQEDER